MKGDAQGQLWVYREAPVKRRDLREELKKAAGGWKGGPDSTQQIRALGPALLPTGCGTLDESLPSLAPSFCSYTMKKLDEMKGLCCPGWRTRTWNRAWL